MVARWKQPPTRNRDVALLSQEETMEWTPEREDLLRSLCAKGASLAQIKAALKISRTAARNRILKLGIDRALATPWSGTNLRPQHIAHSMPAGHHVSWCAITEGTLLEGCEFFRNSLDTNVRSPHDQSYQKEFPNEQ